MPWGLKKRFNHQIHVAKADYILSLKANHPTLFGQVDAWFKAALAEGTLPLPSEHTTESGHHRTEIRKVWTVSVDSFSSLYQAEAWA